MKKQPGMAFLADLPAHAVLKVVDDLDGALAKMVRGRKAGRKIGFPRFKKKFFNEAGIYCVNQSTTISARAAKLPKLPKLPKLGEVRIRGGHVPDGRLMGARLWRDGDRRWMLSAQFQCARPAPLPHSDVTVGIDEIAAPRGLRRAQKRLRRAQRRLSARRKGSARRRAQVVRVAAIHRKVRERRKNLLHQLSHRLTAKAGTVKLESLNVRGMARNGHLAMSVHDAGIGRLVELIAYKADWRGRAVEMIDPWFPSSQMCAGCGVLHREMRDLGRRHFACADCGHAEGRDRNAARNIFGYGQEGRNRGVAPTDAESGGHGSGFSPDRVPLVETSMLTTVLADESE